MDTRKCLANHSNQPMSLPCPPATYLLCSFEMVPNFSAFF